MSESPRLRIIGGRWRGRRLPLPADASVRPTPARLRETLFNWLNYRLAGRRCLDLFAGSGSLGFEALSRGAAHATLVDSDARLCAQLKKRVESFGAHDAVDVFHGAAAQFLARATREADDAFDLVFLDPPFDGELLKTSLAALVQGRNLLGDDALIYVEHPKRDAFEPPAGWRVQRRAQAASVACALLEAAIAPSPSYNPSA